MAVATLVVQQFTGAAPTKTTVTTPRLSTSDSAAPGTANPIPIPDAPGSGLFILDGTPPDHHRYE